MSVVVQWGFPHGSLLVPVALCSSIWISERRYLWIPEAPKCSTTNCGFHRLTSIPFSYSPKDYPNVFCKVITASMKWRYQMKPLLQLLFPRAMAGPPEQTF